MKPHPETLLMELAHQASYRNNTLGLPSLCPTNNITKVKVSKVFILSISACSSQI